MSYFKIPAVGILLIFTVLCSSFQVLSQDSAWKLTYWLNDWKIEAKTGMGTILTEVPHEYLGLLNDINIPVKEIGTANTFSLRKSMTPHLEMGCQFEYLQIQGNVIQEEVNYRVKTQAFGNNLMLLYNLKRTDKLRPRYNYLVYYKVGTISLKNNPQSIWIDGMPPVKYVPVAGNDFISNVAVLTGCGVGITRQFSNNLSMVCSFEINRTSDVAKDIYQIHKLFYHSKNTVNNYSSLTVGASYTFNPSKPKTAGIFSSGTKSENKLLQHSKRKAQRKSAQAKQSLWHK